MTQTAIRLWHGRVSTRFNEYFKFLSDDEKTYVEQLANQTMQARYIQVHGQLRCLLADYLRTAPTTLMIVKAEFGKPFLPDYPALQFNLSHSGDYYAVAITEDVPLGIDVEWFKPRKNYTGLAKKCFAENELNYWRSLPDDQQAECFFRFWTCKEAFVKATGRGIAIGMNQCVFDLISQARLEKIPADYGRVEQWGVTELNLADGVYAALAVKSSNYQINIDAL